MDVTQLVVGLWIGLLFLGVFGVNALKYRAGWLTADESIDHPERHARYRYRFWAWSTSYSLSIFLSAAMFAVPGFDWLTNALPGWMSLPLLFLYPIPLAVLILWFDFRLSRSTSGRRRNGRRRLGLQGYRVKPPVDSFARLHVAFATSEVPPARHAMDEPAEREDTELAREFARKHWDAINFAIASGAGLASAERRQSLYLDRLLARLPDPASQRMLYAYREESVSHARTAAGIVSRQNERAGSRPCSASASGATATCCLRSCW